MTTHDASRPVPALTLGHGPTELEAFLEPTCPYSKRAFEKFPALVEAAGADRLTIRIRFLSQPWHLYSGVVTKGVLAAAAAGGAETGLKVMAGIYQDREAYEFDEHCRGTNMDRTPRDILGAISALAGQRPHRAVLLEVRRPRAPLERPLRPADGRPLLAELRH